MISTESPVETVDRFEIDEELLEIFGSEADDLINRIYAGLATIISGTASSEPLWEIRRSAHTLKGAAGAVGLDAVAGLAHLFEDAVNNFAESDDICLLTDIAAALPLSIHQNPDQVSQKIAQFRARFIKKGEDKTAPVYSKAETHQRSTTMLPTSPASVARVSLLKIARCIELSAHASETDRSLASCSTTLAAQSQELSEYLKRLSRLVEIGMPNDLGKIVREMSAVGSAISRISDEFAATVSDRTSASDQIDELLVTMRNICFGTIEPRLKGSIGAAAEEAGTKCELLIENGDVEIDTILLADLAEPMLHILRNCVVHGIEPPDERQMNGKPPAGTIRLNVERNEAVLVISISDDGRGIDLERLKAKSIEGGAISCDDAERLSDAEAFELVFLEGISTAKSVGMTAGRGVGMRIVKESVESKGGSISVSSVPGKGATFILKLPVGELPLHEALTAGSTDDQIPPLRRVLVVDDSPSIRYYASMVLEENGCSVITAENGKGAIELLEASCLPDLIFSDIEMPEIDGFQLLRQIKSDERFRHIPVVVCSSRSDQDCIQAAIDLGAADYILKPFSESDLLKVIPILK